MQPVQRALYTLPTYTGDPAASGQVVCIDFSRLAAFMAEEVLYIAQVHARFQQVGGKRMAQGMHGAVWVDACL